MTTVVQPKWAQTSGTSNTVFVTLDSTPTLGNLLVAVVTSNSTMGTVSAHPFGAAPDVTGGSGPTVAIYSKVAGHTESTTYTFTTAATRNLSISVVEVAPTSGLIWSGVDVSATNSGSSVSSLPLGPTGTQVAADNIAIAGIGLNGSPATTPGWSNSYTTAGSPTSDARGFAGYKVLSSTAATSTTGSWTTARNAGGAVATYKQIDPPTPTGFIALL